jgi:DNA-directed RNA polymerase specialized sigma24 family protein
MQQHERVALNDSPIAVMYQRQAPVIFAYLCRHASSREDAEDLLLEVFLAALEHRKFQALGEKEQQANWSHSRATMVLCGYGIL